MTTNAPSATPPKAAAPRRLRRRAEFLRAAASGLSRHGGAFKLQMAIRDEDAGGVPRFGVTVTKKIAGAVGRNEIRRNSRKRYASAALSPPVRDEITSSSLGGRR